MDGVHDLGGKQGFGPVDVNEVDTPFHHDWEGRSWAIVRLVKSPDWTIDWWRHVREMQDPSDYLDRPYFDSWAQTHMTALIDSGVLTLDEVLTGKTATPDEKGKAPVLDHAGVLAVVHASAQRFDHEIAAKPAFQPGDKVRAKHWTTKGHTRLPAYARGRPGVIHAHHGAHDFADLSAKGVHEAQHIYSVRFQSCDLWPEAADSVDSVFLDLWESYLEPA